MKRSRLEISFRRCGERTKRVGKRGELVTTWDACIHVETVEICPRSRALSRPVVKNHVDDDDKLARESPLPSRTKASFPRVLARFNNRDNQLQPKTQSVGARLAS